MGRRGPAPTPTKVKRLRGETRPSRLNNAEPIPPADLPKMPTDMDPDAKAVWRRVIRDMRHTGVIRSADADVLRTSTDGISPERAVAWLEALSATWRAAEVPAERADVLHAIYDRITIAGRKIVSVRLTPSAYAHGFALALPQKVAMARPTGVGRALATYEIPIEGRDEWLAAARRLA